MSDNRPFCWSEIDNNYMLESWKCETSRDNQGLHQSYVCLYRQRDQLLERIKALEIELNWRKREYWNDLLDTDRG